MRINNKLILMFMFMFVLLTGFTSSLETLGSYKQGECLDVRQTCVSCSYVNISITNPNSTIVLNNTGMDNQGSGVWIKEFCETGTTGRYGVVGAGDLDGTDTSFAYFFDVTPNGKTYNTGGSLVYIFVALFFIAMMLGFYKVSKSINYEAWYEKIKEKYITRNFVKWSLAAIGYNIMNNSFIVYFLLGLPIMLILMDLVFIFNITSIALYMQSLLYIYIVLVMVLGVVFLGFLQEWFMDFIKDIQEIDWGIDKNG